MNNKICKRIYKMNITKLLNVEDKSFLTKQFEDNRRLYNSLNYIGRMCYFYYLDKDDTRVNLESLDDYNIKEWFYGDKGHLSNKYFYSTIIKNVTKTNNIVLNKKVANQTAITLTRNWKSYFKLKEINVKRKIPKYKKGLSFVALEYNNQAISSKSLKEGYIKPTGFTKGFKIPKKYKDNHIQKVNITYDGYNFIMYVIYKYEKPIVNKIVSDKVASIDLGVDITCLLTFNYNKKPIGFNGKHLKSINQWHNKVTSSMQSKLPKGQYLSKRIINQWNKRNNQINNYVHCLTNQIVKIISKEQIGTLVIGKNIDFQRNVNLGRRNNQNFVNIPFSKIISTLLYKLEDLCDVVIQEESYTSKASYYNDDIIPIYSEENTKYQFSGYRTTRGMYKIKDENKYIHADVNGSYNIMRKYLGNEKCNKSENIGNWLSSGIIVMPYIEKVKLA